MQNIEKFIIQRLIADMERAGYHVAAVWDGEQYQMVDAEGRPISLDRGPAHAKRAMSVAQALDSIDSVDDSTLHFTHKDASTWGDRGVLLILSNGEDVISDYHAGDAVFESIIERIYDAISDQTLADASMAVP